MTHTTTKEYTLLIERNDGSKLNFFKVMASSASEAIAMFKRSQEKRLYRIIKVMNQF